MYSSSKQYEVLGQLNDGEISGIKVSGLAAWTENCKWNRSLPLGAVVSLFCGSV
jgi:hypothetical protein